MRRTRFVLVTAAVVTAVALAGTAAAQEPGHLGHEGHEHAIGVEQVTVTETLDPATEAAIKARGDQAFGTVRLDIDAAADTLPAYDAAQIPTAIMDAMLPVEMPVLVPASLAAALPEAYLFGQVDAYSLALEQDGATIIIEGSRRAFDYPQIEAGSMDAFKDAHGAIIGRTHGIVSAGFERFGLAYQIDVECARPTEDARCTEDAFVHGLIEDLAIAGGTF